MKLVIKFMVLITMATMGSAAYAQTKQTAKAPPQNEISSEGFRLGVSKPMLQYKRNGKLNDGTNVDHSEDIDSALGLSAGYASLPVQDLGWIVNATYLDLKNNGISDQMVRLDGNFAFAFTHLLNIKGGLNYSKIMGNDNTDIEPGIGFQVGVGFQLNKNFGIDLGYTEMNQSSTDSGNDINFKESGFEIGLNGTF